jgi:hypothetical protein
MPGVAIPVKNLSNPWANEAFSSWEHLSSGQIAKEMLEKKYSEYLSKILISILHPFIPHKVHSS